MSLLLFFKFTFLFFIFFRDVLATIDINFPEYQYLADHLTEKECRKFVTALHFKEFEIPNSLDAAEKELPKDVSCVDLLLLWNSTPNAGKGETHIFVCHRLNQIGRTDLAMWLTKTVFHQLSKNLKDSMALTKISETTPLSKSFQDKDICIEETDWWTFDTFLFIVFVLGSALLIIEILFLCYLKATKKSLLLDKWPKANGLD